VIVLTPVSRTRDRILTVTIPLGSGGAARFDSLAATDETIKDGSASLAIWQSGISSRAALGHDNQRPDRHHATITGGIVVDLTSAPNSFETLRIARRADGRRVILTLAERFNSR